MITLMAFQCKNINTTVQKFFKEINTFILQGCIKLIKHGSKDFNIITKTFYSSNHPEINATVVLLSFLWITHHF